MDLQKGDRVIYKNKNNRGSDEFNGNLGTFVGVQNDNAHANVKWDNGESRDPFLKNISLVEKGGETTMKVRELTALQKSALNEDMQILLEEGIIDSSLNLQSVVTIYEFFLRKFGKELADEIRARRAEEEAKTAKASK